MAEEAPFRARAPLTSAEALDILHTSHVELLGRMPYSSNATFLVDLHVDDRVPAQAIYKPARGERPLWDFPPDLYKREAAAYELDAQLGWGHVPPTIVRDGPLGIGSLQLFVPADFGEHYFTMLDDRRFHSDFMKICAFDLVANNTDRKSGHVLLGEDGRIWAIDNGLSFHVEFKVRTVIWEYAGQTLPSEICEALGRFVEDGPNAELTTLLDRDESDAAIGRARALMTAGRFPHDPSGMRYPWPMV